MPYQWTLPRFRYLVFGSVDSAVSDIVTGFAIVLQKNVPNNQYIRTWRDKFVSFYAMSWITY